MSINDSEGVEPFEKDQLTEVEKLRFDYAWKWFDFQAKQRMQLFNFFLIITGILATAYISAYEKRLFIMSIAVGLIGTLQAFGFLVFDVRSRELTRYAEDVLEKIEKDQLFTKNYTKDGHPLGFMLRETHSKMREGSSSRGFWGNLRKMKVWIRFIEIIVGLVFLAGLIIASIQLSSNTLIQPSTATPNQNSAVFDSAKQSNTNTNSVGSTGESK